MDGNPRSPHACSWSARRLAGKTVRRGRRNQCRQRDITAMLLGTSVLVLTITSLLLPAAWAAEEAKLILTETSRIPEADAVERFLLRDRLECLNQDGHFIKGDVAVYEGDLLVDGDLVIDWDEPSTVVQRGQSGLVINGDLTVTGSVINAELDFGPFLVVLGTLRTQNLVAGGAEIVVAGDAEVSHLVLAVYNHGRLNIAGGTRAGLILSSDHSTEIRTTSPYWDDREDFSWPAPRAEGMPLSEHLHAAIEVENHDEDGVRFETVEPEVLIRRLQAGQPVLRDPADPRPRRDAAAWRATIVADPCLLWHVPPEFIDHSLALIAVADCAAMLEYVPPGLRTQKVCAAAMADHALAFPFVPEDLRSPEWSHLAIELDGSYLEHVPRQHRTPELCRQAVEDDAAGAIWAVPETHQTNELLVIAVTRRPWILRKLAPDLRTMEVCSAAVKHAPSLVSEVPDALRDAVTAHIEAVKPPSDEIIDAEIQARFLYDRDSLGEEIESLEEMIIGYQLVCIREAVEAGETDHLRQLVKVVQVLGRTSATASIKELLSELDRAAESGDLATCSRLVSELEPLLSQLLSDLRGVQQRWPGRWQR